METDRYQTSDRARRRMLHAVYEENRRIVDPDASSWRKGRRALGGAGLLVVAVGITVVIATGRSGDPESDASGLPSLASILDGFAIPDIDTTEGSDEWMAGDEIRALLEQPTPLATLFGLNVRTVVIDPGHGGADPGAVGPSGLLEKDVTLDVARRLERRLSRNGYLVLMTRDGDETKSLRDRVELANRSETDLFVSIHVNSLPVDTVNFLETYYFGADRNPRSLRVAELENRGSDFSVADFNEMIRGVVTTVKLQESRRLARSVQRSLFGNARHLQVPVTDGGSKSGPFVVLLGSQAPSILAEIGVVTNPGDEQRLSTDAHREQLAAFLEEGILNYLISRSREGSGTETVN